MKNQYFIVATAIIHKDGKFFVAQRSPDEDKFPGLWTVPGGKLEFEDIQDIKANGHGIRYDVIEKVIKREVLEETGMSVRNLRYLVSMMYPKKDSFALCLSFLADYDSGEVKLSSELTDSAWISIDEINNVKLIDGIPEELFMAQDLINNGKTKEWKEYEKL